jgi:hypothetical protein
MAIPSGVHWDVRTTGNSANGGGFNLAATGTDYSQQNSPQVTYTDLVIGTTTTQLTSAANPFTSSHVGNIINITGGTGFTAGRYCVNSVSGGVATMDRAVGTASSTGGAGNLGGSVALPSDITSNLVGGQTIWVKAGSYSVSSQLGGGSPGLTWAGYNATHGDNAAQPTITMTANSTVLIQGPVTGQQFVLQNLKLTTTAATPSIAITLGSNSICLIKNVWVAAGFTNGMSLSNNPFVEDCYIGATTTGSAITGGGIVTLTIRNTVILGSHGAGINLTSGNVAMYNCIVAGGANRGVFFNNWAIISGSTIAGNAGDGIFLQGANGGSVLTNPNQLWVESCIIYGNTGYGVNCPNTGTNPGVTFLRNNAVGSNSSGNYHGLSSTGDVTLTTGPFTSSGTGDYSPNNAAGGGAACKAAGYPGAFVGGTMTGYLDIGAVQSNGGGGSPGNYGFVA